MAYSTPDTHITGYVVTAADWNELVGNDIALAIKDAAIIHTRGDDAVITGNGEYGIPIPASLNGYNVTDILAIVADKGVTGTTDIVVRRSRAGADVDVNSTAVTIGDEWFAADGVINTSNDDLITGDMLFVDVDAVHSGTAPNGLSVAIQVTPTA